MPPCFFLGWDTWGWGKGKGGKQKDQKPIAYLDTWLGAFHYIVGANLVGVIENI